MLGVLLEGGSLQTVLSFWHAVLRCRAVLHGGFHFHDREDMISHLLRLVQHPWLSGSIPGASSRERRAQRARAPPAVPEGVTLYRCDGASRGQGRSGDLGRGSFGAIRYECGRIVGRYAACLGDATNNEAEYAGVLSCLTVGTSCIAGHWTRGCSATHC